MDTLTPTTAPNPGTTGVATGSGDFEHYLAIVAGVAVSVLLPLVRQFVPTPMRPHALPPTELGQPSWWRTVFWPTAKPYVFTALFSLLGAVVILVFLGDSIKTWKAAFLAGYTADATLQKITTTGR